MNRRALTLAALTIVCWVPVVFSAVHLDLSRDMFVAWRFVHGEEIPLTGPVLAESIHLGPVYYWLLALFLALTRSWLGAVALLGLLGSLKVPLAYLVGKELHSRRAGYMFAVGLLVPAWGTFEWLFPGHNLLTTPLTLAFLLCAIRYCRRPRRKYLIGMALALALALHAHPTSVALAWIGLGVLWWVGRHGQLRAQDLLVAAAIGLLPFVPYLLSEAMHGFADIRSGTHYLSAGVSTGQLATASPILVATAIGGTRYWFASVLVWPTTSVNLACVLIAACGWVGIAGAILTLIRVPRQRALLLAALAAIFSVALTTALIRNVTPYYQTVVLRTLLIGTVAIGLAGLGEQAGAKVLRCVAISVALCAYAIGAAGFVRLQSRGDWPFSFFPLFDVAGTSLPTKPFLALPAYAIAGTGDFLCQSAAPSAHGILAQQLLHDYAMDMRLACARSDVKLGGDDAAREHWLGLSRAVFAQLHVEPAHYFGSMGIAAAHPFAFGKTLDPQPRPIYPAYEPRLAAPSEQHVHLHLGAAEHLAISNIAWSFAPDPDVSVTIDGRPSAALAEDTVAKVYACNSGMRCDIDITIRSADADDVDVVTF